jgi:hypothetical protein
MKHLPKDVQRLKDKELLPHLFPKEVLKKLKEEIDKPKLKIVRKKS